MAQTYSLVTGANGEIGHSLLEALHAEGKSIIAVDLQPFSDEAAARCARTYSGTMGDITNPDLYTDLLNYDVTEVFHLAALLSTSAEKNPSLAQTVNVGGTLRLLEYARETGKRLGTPVVFMFPSTIAVYGFPTLDDKVRAGRIDEMQGLQPRTMYGINKLYCENLGTYFDELYMQLSPTKESGWVDFRGVRFPGLISAFTVPTGGTSDYAPEMVHAAAQGKPYACFVRPDARIPFMAMPDGVRALLELRTAAKASLTRHIYNIGAFAPSADEIRAKVQGIFPSADVSFSPHLQRQAIVDSWCMDVDDDAARKDWGWHAEYDFDRTFSEYLAPHITKRYASGT
ncbi:MAG: NAD-dependent epimerase/dehydratase family protein [Candidatus Kapaibacterium sp.]